jgi:hypothetical protein
MLSLSHPRRRTFVEYIDTGKISARSVVGERIIFARPGPELEYWEDED